jgi:hypothetical protein
MNRLLAVPVTVVLLAALAGCNRELVTPELYQLAFERYSDCLSEAGTPLVEADLTGPVYEYAAPASAVYSGAEDRCYADFRAIDVEWQAIQRRAAGSG